MEVIDSLTAVGAGVDHEAIPIGEALRPGNLAGGGEQRTEQGGVLGQRMGVRRDVTFGDDQHMHGGLRVNVGEGKRVGGFVEALGRDRAGDDFAKKAVQGGRVSHATIIVGGRHGATGSF